MSARALTSAAALSGPLRSVRSLTRARMCCARGPLTLGFFGSNTGEGDCAEGCPPHNGHNQWMARAHVRLLTCQYG